MNTWLTLIVKCGPGKIVSHGISITPQTFSVTLYSWPESPVSFLKKELCWCWVALFELVTDLHPVLFVSQAGKLSWAGFLPPFHFLICEVILVLLLEYFHTGLCLTIPQLLPQCRKYKVRRPGFYLSSTTK